MGASPSRNIKVSPQVQSASVVAPASVEMGSRFPYIVKKNKDCNEEIEGYLSFIAIISMVILIVLLFFISYKVFIFMNFFSINEYDIGLYPNSSSDNPDGYDLNYLTEQVYYKSLSDTDKDSYLALPDFEKDVAIKKYLVGQIVL